MNEEVKNIIKHMEDAMNKALQHLEVELAKVRAGKANPSILDNVFVDFYGVKTPINQASTVSTPDARTIIIQPWDKSMLTPIEKAIQVANLGFNPQNDGTLIRIVIPPLTEERRKELVKKAKAEAEQAKITIRNARREANDNIKKLIKKSITEDEANVAEENVQKITDSYIAKVDKHSEIKEKEIMTI